MTVSSVPRIQINGAIDTSQTVMANINNIATNSQSWVTWDTTIAKWRIIANAPAPTNTAYTFDNSTIIGGISVTGTPLEKMYNAAEITFNNDELRDDTDSIGIRLPESQRYPNESENSVNLNYTLINNPVHAQILGSIELLQSRLDKIITFTTDFSSAGLTAGEVIRVNAPIYGYSNKLFRVTSIEESDEDDGGILFRITAVEYDSSVYSGSFTRDARTKATDIIPFELNNCVQDSEAEDTIDDILKIAGAVLINIGDSAIINLQGKGKLMSINDFEFGTSMIYDDVLGGFYPSTLFDPNSATDRYDVGYSFTAPFKGSYYIDPLYSSAMVWDSSVYGQSPLDEGTLPLRYRVRFQMCIKKNNVFVNSMFGSVIYNEWRQSVRNTLIPGGVTLEKGETIDFYSHYITDFDGTVNSILGPGSRAGFRILFKIYYRKD